MLTIVHYAENSFFSFSNVTFWVHPGSVCVKEDTYDWIGTFLGTFDSGKSVPLNAVI